MTTAAQLNSLFAELDAYLDTLEGYRSRRTYTHNLHTVYDPKARTTRTAVDSVNISVVFIQRWPEDTRAVEKHLEDLMASHGLASQWPSLHGNQVNVGGYFEYEMRVI